MTPKKPAPEPRNRYDALIEAVFFENYKPGATEVPFSRPEFEAHAKHLGIVLPKNPGDILYSYRNYRSELPAKVRGAAGTGREWLIAGAGRAKYIFRKSPESRIEPQKGRYRIKIPNATPEIVAQFPLDDEQATLARIRYNRLIDVFLTITAYSLQNHLRTTVKGIGQIEIDELYVGVNQNGAQFIVPVQAKGMGERIGAVQLQQDLAFCAEEFPQLIARSVAAQSIEDDVIAMFELKFKGDTVQILEEKHYHLVAADEITDEDLETMRADTPRKAKATRK